MLFLLLKTLCSNDSIQNVAKLRLVRNSHERFFFSQNFHVRLNYWFCVRTQRNE